MTDKLEDRQDRGLGEEGESIREYFEGKALLDMPLPSSTDDLFKKIEQIWAL